jgi:hypothetical protein
MAPPQHKDAQHAEHLIKQRDKSDGFRRLAIERKLASLPPHVVKAAQAKHTEGLTFEPLEIQGSVFDLGGREPAGFIDKQVARLQSAIGEYWSNYDAGLNNFQLKMTTASKSEAESQYLTVALKAVAKVDLDMFLDGLAEGAPELGVPIKMAKEVITKELEEKERVEKAEGELEVADYIHHLRTRFVALKNNEIEQIDALGTKVNADYQKLAPDSGGQATVVYGDGATLLKNFQKAVEHFHAAATKKTAPEFEEKIAEAFALKGDKELVGRVSQGAHLNGTLYIECTALLKNGKWTIPDCDRKWILWTNSPNAGRVADDLRVAMEEQGDKGVVDSDLEKKVKVTLDIDSGSALTPDDYEELTISFTDINHPTFGATLGEIHASKPKEAWDAAIKGKVAGIREVDGKND